MNVLLQLALAYAPPPTRDALTALWRLDEMLGRIVATTTDPLVGQMRLTWWHNRLTRLDQGEREAEPTLIALHAVITKFDVSGTQIAALVEGWEAVLDPLPLSSEALSAFATRRGDTLFRMAGVVTNKAVSPGLGAGWALIDFAEHCSDERSARRAWQAAGELFDLTPIRGPAFVRILARVASAKAARRFEKLSDPPSRLALLRGILP